MPTVFIGCMRVVNKTVDTFSLLAITSQLICKLSCNKEEFSYMFPNFYFTQFHVIFVQLFLIRTAHALPYDNAPSVVCTLMEEEEEEEEEENMSAV
jgi:hypothetical protein